jgi:hypothetical protein
MELICEKYRDRMAATEAKCRHPTEYCKFRSSCMIRILAGEKAEDNDSPPQGGRKATGKTAAD